MRIPEAGRLLWAFFIEISETRTYHAGGPNPISHAEIDAWARLNRWPLEPHHVAILREMDGAFLKHVYARTSGNAVPQSSGQAVNPAVFDAVFG